MTKPAVAVIGASPRNIFTTWGTKNLRLFNPDLEIWPVTPSYDEVSGLPAYDTVGDLPYPPTAAIVAVRRELAVDIVRELAQMGTADIALVTAGFTERGDEEGVRLAALLQEAIRGTATRVWGPNCIGFSDFTVGICCINQPTHPEVRPGNISFVSQSGAFLSGVLAGFINEDLGMDWCVSCGNGELMGSAAAIKYAAQRETTKVVCAYVEGVPVDGGHEALADALATAQSLGKRVIILKSGVSGLAKRAVKAHTASNAGDDAVFDALLAQYGAIRVYTIDELVRAANIAVSFDLPLNGELGIGVLGNSGGGAVLCSEYAARAGTHLARMTPATAEKLVELSGPGSFLENPFDVLVAPDMYGPEGVIATIVNDPNVGFVIMPWAVQFPDYSDEEGYHRTTWQHVADFATATGKPTMICSLSTEPWTEFSADFRAKNPHLRVVTRLDLTIDILSRFFPDPSGASTK